MRPARKSGEWRAGRAIFSRVSPSWLSSKRFTAHLSWPDGRLPEKFLVLLLHKNMSSGVCCVEFYFCISSSTRCPSELRGSGPGPPRRPVLGALDQASVVGHDFVLRQMKGKFQGHQHRELKGNQFSSIQPELLLQLLQQK